MASTKIRLPRYRRIPKPPPMRLTDRDKRIIETLHAYDGMLGFSQIRRLFFTGKSQAEHRLKLLTNTNIRTDQTKPNADVCQR